MIVGKQIWIYCRTYICHQKSTKFFLVVFFSFFFWIESKNSQKVRYALSNFHSKRVRWFVFSFLGTNFEVHKNQLRFSGDKCHKKRFISHITGTRLLPTKCFLCEIVCCCLCVCCRWAQLLAFSPRGTSEIGGGGGILTKFVFWCR